VTRFLHPRGILLQFSTTSRHRMNRRTLRLLGIAWLASTPCAAAAHLLDGSPNPLPRWVSVAGLIIVGVMGGMVGFAISKHRQSMDRQKKERLQRAAQAAASPAGNDHPPERRL
jgi:hypothetical protein